MREPCNCGGIPPSLTEEMILNPGALPEHMRGMRRYRIEYGFECACPEGLIYLPAHVNAETVEALLRVKE